MDEARTVLTRPRRRFAVVALAVTAGGILGFKFAGNLGFAVVGGLFGFLFGWRFAQFRYGNPTYSQRYPSARLSVILAGGAWAVELIALCGLVAPEFLKGDNIVRLGIFLMFPLTILLWIFGGLLASSSARHALTQVAAGTRPAMDAAIARLGLKLSRLFTGLMLLYVIWIGGMMSGCGR